MVGVEVGEEPVAVGQPRGQLVEPVNHKRGARDQVPWLERDWLGGGTPADEAESTAYQRSEVVHNNDSDREKVQGVEWDRLGDSTPAEERVPTGHQLP